MDKRDKRVIIFVAIIWIGIIMYSVFNPTPSYKVVRLDNDNDTVKSVAEVVYVDDNGALADIPTSVQPLVRTIDGEPISSKPVGPWWNSPEIAGRNDDPGPGPGHTSSKDYSSYEEYRELINSLKGE